jgi:hypothetical protein
MRHLPTGTVTFLFTDIEGSTSLLLELGDAYPKALAGHRRLLRRLEADPESWKRHACLVPGRKLSEREWKDALPDRAYRTVC